MSLVIDPEEKGASLAAEIHRTLLPIRTFGGLLGFAISPQVAAVTRRWSGRQQRKSAISLGEYAAESCCLYRRRSFCCIS